jgi:hypothetical protein
MIEKITATVAIAGLLAGCSPEQPSESENPPPQITLEVAQDSSYMLVEKGPSVQKWALKAGETVIGICVERLAPPNDPFQTGAFIAAKRGRTIRTATFIGKEGLQTDLYKDYPEERLAQEFPFCNDIDFQEAALAARIASRVDVS